MGEGEGEGERGGGREREGEREEEMLSSSSRLSKLTLTSLIRLLQSSLRICGTNKTIRVEHDLSIHGIIWDHHGHGMEQNL